MQSDVSSVRIVRPSAKISPEPFIPTLVTEPEEAPRCVFGVALETLREEGQMVCGIPLVLRDMVDYLDRNGNCSTPHTHTPFSVSPYSSFLPCFFLQHHLNVHLTNSLSSLQEYSIEVCSVCVGQWCEPGS